MFFTGKRIDTVVALHRVLALVSPPVERVRLDYAVIDRILEGGAQDRLDIDMQ